MALGRTHTALEECIFLAEQFEYHWGKKVWTVLLFNRGVVGGGLAADHSLSSNASVL